MRPLPDHIKQRFYRTINGDISISDFEQWLYTEKELEGLLLPEDYLTIISIGYKTKGAKYELWKVLSRYIDLGEFETFKMLGLLSETKQKTERLPSILRAFYSLYCKGYIFLEDLGLGYGLSVEVPLTDNIPAKTWEDLSEQQQIDLINSFSPGLEEEADRVIGWLTSGKIVLTGEQDVTGNYTYEDSRTEEESKSRLWVTVHEDKSKGSSIIKNLLWNQKGDKRWWKFWKSKAK